MSSKSKLKLIPTNNKLEVIGNEINKIREDNDISLYTLMFKGTPKVHIKSIQRLENGESVNLQTFLNILEQLDIELILKIK